MSNEISNKLRASLRFGAHEGNAAERSVFISQVRRAVDALDAMAIEISELRAERDIACTALCPHGLDIAAQKESAERERDALVDDAYRWRSMRRRLLTASIASGRHDSGAAYHCPIGDVCTEAYWDRLADHALAMDEDAPRNDEATR